MGAGQIGGAVIGAFLGVGYVQEQHHNRKNNVLILEEFVTEAQEELTESIDSELFSSRERIYGVPDQEASA